MTSDQQRAERVQQGSRRQRDLAAVKAQAGGGVAIAWAERELPDESPILAAAAYATELRGSHSPTAESVLRRLKAQGRDWATLGKGSAP
jgi:hypothetical protein